MMFDRLYRQCVQAADPPMTRIEAHHDGSKASLRQATSLPLGAPSTVRRGVHHIAACQTGGV